MKKIFFLLCVFLIFIQCNSHSQELKKTEEETCNCFRYFETIRSFKATQVSLKTAGTDTLLTAHCALVAIISYNDDKGEEREKFKKDCVSQEERSFRITKNTEFLIDDKYGNDLFPESAAKKEFFSLIKNPETLWDIKCDSATNNILSVSQFYMPD